ncbi:SurA N-terminal domain-containing protein [Oceanidesulfovibrio indonesiensis]|nr:SurA N-terminal domain-containing protein [Oceanidesulfovibrio indonesiensis]
MLRIVIFAVALFALIAASGCDYEEPREEGVVARVNGEPIYLHELENAYDIQHLGWTADSELTVGRLRSQYGKVLTTLIVQKLVEQELQSRGIAVPPERVNQAEAQVRVDYPKDEFEKILVEEYIDLDAWREHLRASIAKQVFMEEVLRPRITLDYDEIEAYYKAHREEFNRPARIQFALISGPERRMVRDAATLYLEGGDERQLRQAYPRVSLQEMTVRKDRLPSHWQEALESLDPSEASSVTAGQSGFETIILKQRFAAETLDAARAYPIVERILLERKQQTAFEGWLEDKLDNATVLISEHLIPGASEEESLPVRGAEETEPRPYWGEAPERDQPDEERVPESELVPDALDGQNAGADN